MAYAQVHSCTVLGIKAPAVTVEVHLANGLPQFALVGLADTEVREARERVRSAILNSGLEFPTNKRIIVNLAPADLPKESGRFDLAIAVGILVASEQLDPQAVSNMCLRANCLCLASCARCAAHSPWHWVCNNINPLWLGCCRRTAPRKPPCCRTRRCTEPCI